MSRTLRGPFLIIALALTTGIASAQVQTGTPPFGSFDRQVFGTINLANLNVHLAIPVIAKPGRVTPFTYTLSYDNSVWYPVGSSGNQNWQPVFNWGWAAQGAGSTGQITYSQYIQYCYDQSGHPVGAIVYLQNWVYHDPWGINHPFVGQLVHYAGCPGTDTSSFSSTATDGSGLTLNAVLGGGSTIVTPGGTVLSPPVNMSSGTSSAATTVTDRNGNQITSNSNGVFTDTLGTTAVTVAGSVPNPTTFTYTAPSGASAAVTMNYSAYAVQTNFGCSGIGEYGPITNIYLVSSIVLADDGHPNPDRYTISYEPTYNNPGKVTGRIASIQLPTGSTITYSYGTGGVNGINCADGSAAGLTATTSDGTWTYGRTPGTGAAYTTTVTTPPDPATQQSNQTKIQFQGIYETHREVYQGSSTSGTLLQTTDTCYNNSATPCTEIAVSLPILQRNVTIQLPGGLQCLHATTYNSYGLATEVDDYDYGSAPHGALIRKQLVTFANLGLYLHNFTQIFTTQDGSNNTVSQTRYVYDEGTPTSTSNTPQHIAVSGARGNATTILTYFSSGALPLVAQATYYDTGTLQTTTDVNGALTTYNYDAATSCGNSFPTSISLPLSLSQSMTWNCTGGVQTLATDENNKQTTTAFTDAYFWRPASMTDPAGALTSFTYPSPNAAEQAMNFNGSSSTVDTRTTLDGLGRAQILQTKQGPGSANYDSVETDYDSLGRPSRVTMPYSTPAGQTNPSAPAITTTYDALGRVLQVTDAGTGTTTRTYLQKNDVLLTIGPAPSGEHTKRRQFEYDALDRLTSVCELTGLSGSGDCAQNVPATGYSTKYTFDATGRLLNVTQNAQSGTSQNRAYAYDQMGRLTSETNPENGQTQYAYDTVGGYQCPGTYNGDLIRVNDARGNTRCYTYDALHRVTSITYSGPYATSTPNKYFVYDGATINTTPPTTMLNVKGRLAEAYTATCPTCSKITDLGFSYSSRGEVADVYESTPNSGGYYHVSATYWANGLLNQLSNLVGLPTITYTPDGEGRPYSVSANPGQNPVTSTIYNLYASPPQITVNFGSGDFDVFNYDVNTGRKTRYQFNVGTQSVTGALTWNANGTLGQLQITDPINATDNQTCNYGYDDLNRIGSANCGAAWSQTFGYDAFGNLTKSGSMSFQPVYTDPITGQNTNRYISIPGATVSYDANGNVLSDGSHTYAWDADGNSVTIDGVGLTYDALDRKVEQNRSGSYTQIVYAPRGGKLALMNGQTLQKAFVPLPGRAVAVYASTGLSYYRHSDWLGSDRLTSTPSRTVSSSIAYGPFGETYAQYGTADPSFTGQNQDTVAGLYDFPDREYSTQGRWPSPDPAGLVAVNPHNPQSWNRYAYVMNNPLGFIDPTGLYCQWDDGTSDAVSPEECAGGEWKDDDLSTDPPGVVDVYGELSSFWSSFFSSPVPIYVENDVRLSPSQRAVLGGAYQNSRAVSDLADVAVCVAGGMVTGSDQVFSPVFTHVATEGVTHTLENAKTATAVTRAYYSATDGRFTRWGKFSKVLVPRTAAVLQPVLTAAGRLFSVAGWVLLAAEGAELTQGCASQIQ